MLVAIDFDECLIDSHLSAAFTSRFAEVNKLSHIPDDLDELLTIYKGTPATTLTELARSVAQDAAWRDGAEVFLKTLLNDPRHRVVILSSGLDLPIMAFMARYHLSSALHCCSLAFENRICTGSKRIVTPQDKALYIQGAIEQDGYHNVLTIGHGSGDTEMMTISRSLCIPSGHPPSEAVALHVSDCFTPNLLMALFEN